MVGRARRHRSGSDLSDSPKSAREVWRGLPRGLRRAVAVVSIGIPTLFLVFMLAVNVMLWSGGVERMASGEHPLSTVELRHGRAWMLWPGTVHVRDFELDIDSHLHQLHVEVPSGTVEIALLDLFSRELRTRSVRGEGAVIWIVLKRPAEDSGKDRPGVPAIADFGPPILRDQPPDVPPRDESWTITIDGIEGRVAEVIVDNVRVDIPVGRVSGSVHAVPGHAFSAPDVSIELEEASVFIADRECLAALDLAVGVDVRAFDPFGGAGRANLAKISGHASASASVVDLGSFASFATSPGRPASEIAVGGGRGQLRIEVEIESGVVEAGSGLDYDTDSLRVHVGDVVVGSALRLRAGVDLDPPRGVPVSRATVDLRGVRGGVVGADTEAVEAGHVHGHVAFAQTDLAATDWPLHDLSVSIPSLTVDDLAALDGLSDAVHLEGGSAELSWETARRDDGDYGTEVRVKLDDGALAFGQTHTRGSGEARLSARTPATLEETRVRNMDIELDGFALATPRGHSEGTWVRVDSGWLSVDHERGAIEAKLVGRLDDLRPVFAQASARKAVINQVPDLDLTQPLDFQLAIHKYGASLTVDIDDLSRPGLNVRGKVRHTGADTRYLIMLELAHIGVSGTAGQQPEVDLAIDDDWFERRSAWVVGESSEGR